MSQELFEYVEDAFIECEHCGSPVFFEEVSIHEDVDTGELFVDCPECGIDNDIYEDEILLPEDVLTEELLEEIMDEGLKDRIDYIKKAYGIYKKTKGHIPKKVYTSTTPLVVDRPQFLKTHYNVNPYEIERRKVSGAYGKRLGKHIKKQARKAFLKRALWGKNWAKHMKRPRKNLRQRLGPKTTKEYELYQKLKKQNPVAAMSLNKVLMRGMTSRNPDLQARNARMEKKFMRMGETPAMRKARRAAEREARREARRARRSARREARRGANKLSIPARETI